MKNKLYQLLIKFITSQKYKIIHKIWKILIQKHILIITCAELCLEIPQ